MKYYAEKTRHLKALENKYTALIHELKSSGKETILEVASLKKKVERQEKRIKNLIEKLRKMKLQYTEGCVHDSLSVDGVETIDMKIEDFKNVLHKLLDRETDLGTLQQVFMTLMVQQGKYECDDEPCEQCGDFTTTFTLNI